MLLLRFLDGHQVDLPTGEFRGQAHVLATATDRDRQIFVVDHHIHAVLFLIDQNRRHRRRRQCADDELRGIGRPDDDVDALAGQFIGHCLHARTAHAHTGADRVDAPIGGEHRDLGAHPGVARGRLDLQQPFLDLRHFELEQGLDELRRGARDNHRRSALRTVDFVNIGTNAVTDAKRFARNHLVARQRRLDPARLDQHTVILDALDSAVD